LKGYLLYPTPRFSIVTKTIVLLYFQDHYIGLLKK